MHVHEPILEEELFKIDINYPWLVSNLKVSNNKKADFHLKKLLIKTRFIEISENFRCAIGNSIHDHNNFLNSLEKILNSLQKTKNCLFYADFFLVQELAFNYFSEHMWINQLYYFYINYILFRKTFLLAYYLIKKLEIQTENEKNIFIKSSIGKLDFYFAQKNYKGVRNCITFLQFLIEREEISMIDEYDILLRAGKLSLKEDKIILAFSYFFETFAKLTDLSKMSYNFVFERLIFSSNFIKKQKINALCKNNPYQYNILNFVFLEFINISLHRRNVIGLETSLQKKIWNKSNQTEKFFLTRFFNATINILLKNILETFVRIPFIELSIIFGITKKKIASILSRMIMKKEIKGLLDQSTQSLIIFDSVDTSFFFSNFFDIIIQIDQLVSEII